MSSTRQTQSFLIQRFAEAGIRPDTRHGQNFLIDLNLLDLLVRKANLGPADVVLEIGTGLGSLTARMAPLVAAVITVEIDPRLYQLASEELGNLSNVTMLQQDVLQTKNVLDPVVLAAVKEKLAAHPETYFKLVANLPYNVATPVLSNLLAAEAVPLSMTVTIQKELADRIIAPPGTKDYSALSVWMQSLCEIELVRELPPQVFWPRPKVTSALLHILPHPGKRAEIADPTFFHQFIRALFLHRRKFLRGSLAIAFKDELDKSSIDEILAAFDFPLDVRAEQIDVNTLISLADAVRKRLSPSP